MEEKVVHSQISVAKAWGLKEAKRVAIVVTVKPSPEK